MTGSTSRVESVYIVQPMDTGWIIERIMTGVAARLNGHGVSTRIGPKEGYAGEAVIFNSRFLTPFASPQARVNSLFITHIDDKIKEMELRASFARFNSLVCLSAHEADFVAGLRGDRRGVVGIDLPALDQSVRPLRIAVFSARYPDGRKNEQWLLDYFADKPAEFRRSFILCLMGWDWEGFCAKLSDLEMNYEIYRYSRFTPGEYGFYKEVLPTMDSLVYMGFDGGAMCVYDAVGAGITAIVPNISYHRGLGEAVQLFDDKMGFSHRLDRLYQQIEERRTALNSRSISAYADALLDHWSGMDPSSPELPVTAQVEGEAVTLFRSHYQPIGLSRVRSFVTRFLQSFPVRGA